MNDPSPLLVRHMETPASQWWRPFSSLLTTRSVACSDNFWQQCAFEGINLETWSSIFDNTFEGIWSPHSEIPNGIRISDNRRRQLTDKSNVSDRLESSWMHRRWYEIWAFVPHCSHLLNNCGRLSKNIMKAVITSCMPQGRLRVGYPSSNRTLRQYDSRWEDIDKSFFRLQISPFPD